MFRVLVDARINAPDGIGRYSSNVVKQLGRRSGQRSGIYVDAFSVPARHRYAVEESRDLARTVGESRYDLLHLLDYRVPLYPIGCPVVITIHDLMRHLMPQHCYTDREFVRRFGEEGYKGLGQATELLRCITGEVEPAGEREPWLSCHHEYYSRMIVHSARVASAIVVPSHAVRSQVVSHLRPAAPVIAVPHGVDHLKTEGMDFRGGENFLLYVGQARSHKGLEALLRAIKAPALAARGIRLILVGKDFAPGAEGNQLTGSLASDARVQTFGAVSDTELASLYARAVALIHLAQHEGFGFTPLEAFLHGTATIVCDLPVFRETLGSLARYVDPEDACEVAAAVDAVLLEVDDRDLHARRRALAEGFTWERTANGTMGVYRSVLISREPRSRSED
jgi:glycosyltransferase involved in cell wall biosynthesis